MEIATEAQRFVMPSFDPYFAPYEEGAGSPGQAFILIPEEVRRAVREEVRRDLGDTGGAIEVEVEIRFGSGRRSRIDNRVAGLLTKLGASLERGKD